MKKSLKYIIFALTATASIASITAGTVAFVECSKTDFTGIKGQEIVKPTKLHQDAPVLTQDESVTTNSIIMPIIDGAEYSLNSTDWQDSNIFSGLIPGSEYTVYVRYPETDEYYASDSISVSVTLDKLTMDAPSIRISSYSATSITVSLIANCEYSINGTSWQISNVFEDLTPGTTYTVYIRYMETATQHASEYSTTQVTLQKSTTATPSMTGLVSVTNDTIIAPYIQGAEYSLNGIDWQDSNTFTNLSPNTEYSVQARIKETATQEASGIATSDTYMTTSKAPGLYVDNALTMTWQQLLDNNYFTMGSSSALSVINDQLQKGSNSSVTELTGELVLEGCITSVVNSMFEGTSFSSFVLSPNMNRLSAYMFEGCTNLTEFTIPSTISSITYGVFNDCTNLHTITITRATYLSPYRAPGVIQITNPAIFDDNITTINMTQAVYDSIFDSSAYKQYWNYYSDRITIIDNLES